MDKERERFLNGFSYFKKGGKLSVLEVRGFSAEVAGFKAARDGASDSDRAADAYQRSTAMVQRPVVEVDENGFVVTGG